MLIADTFRGVHSTGVFGVGPNKRGMYKKAIAAWDFVQLEQYAEWFRDFNGYEAVIGHNRAATQGKVNTANAHPFTHGHITGVHNGTLRNHRQLTGGSKFTVDSEALIYSIMKDGYIKTLEATEGAYAVVWWDHKEYKLRMARNSERPMYFAFVKDKNTMLYASEAGLLKWIAERNKLNVEEVFYVQPGTVVTFDMANLRDYKVENFKVKHTSFASYGGYNSAKNPPANTNRKKMKVVPYHFDGNKKGETGTVTAVPISTDGEERDVLIYNVHKNVYAEAQEENKYLEVETQGTVLFNGKTRILGVTNTLTLGEFDEPEYKFFKGYNGDYLTESEFKKAVEDGCSICTGNIYPEDDTKMDWIGWNQPICPECVKQYQHVNLSGVTA